MDDNNGKFPGEDEYFPGEQEYSSGGAARSKPSPAPKQDNPFGGSKGGNENPFGGHNEPEVRIEVEENKHKKQAQEEQFFEGQFEGVEPEPKKKGKKYKSSGQSDGFPGQDEGFPGQEPAKKKKPKSSGGGGNKSGWPGFPGDDSTTNEPDEPAPSSGRGFPGEDSHVQKNESSGDGCSCPCESCDDCIEKFKLYADRSAMITSVLQGFVFLYLFLEQETWTWILFLALLATGLVGVFCKVKYAYIAYGVGTAAYGAYSVIAGIQEARGGFAFLHFLFAAFEFFVTLLCVYIFFRERGNDQNKYQRSTV